jgi:protein-tyrosine phosphatase
MTRRLNVIFVCMGNICRSPTAHAVFLRKVADMGWASQVSVDSAGTHALHVGEPPDPRSQLHAGRRGYDLSDLRARQFVPQDLGRADLVLAMDEDNRARVTALCGPVLPGKVQLLTQYCRNHASEIVPDPYYGGAEDFETVLDLIEDACDGLLEHFRNIFSKA